MNILEEMLIALDDELDFYEYGSIEEIEGGGDYAETLEGECPG